MTLSKIRTEVRAPLLEVWTFCRAHWVHGLLVIPGAVTFTIFHELAHCIAVWVQGGTVTEFVWVPTGQNWGHMAYQYQPDGTFNRAVVSLAPYGFWIGSVLLVYGISHLRKRWPFWVASTCYVWLVVAPLADLLNAALPYVLYNTHNDFYSAFGSSSPALVLGLSLLGLACVAIGYPIQRNLYGEKSLSVSTYSLLAGGVIGGVSLISVGL